MDFRQRIWRSSGRWALRSDGRSHVQAYRHRMGFRFMKSRVLPSRSLLVVLIITLIGSLALAEPVKRGSRHGGSARKATKASGDKAKATRRGGRSERLAARGGRGRQGRLARGRGRYRGSRWARHNVAA